MSNSDNAPERTSGDPEEFSQNTAGRNSRQGQGWSEQLRHEQEQQLRALLRQMQEERRPRERFQEMQRQNLIALANASAGANDLSALLALLSRSKPQQQGAQPRPPVRDEEATMLSQLQQKQHQQELAARAFQPMNCFPQRGLFQQQSPAHHLESLSSSVPPHPSQRPPNQMPPPQLQGERGFPGMSEAPANPISFWRHFEELLGAAQQGRPAGRQQPMGSTPHYPDNSDLLADSVVNGLTGGRNIGAVQQESTGRHPGSSLYYGGGSDMRWMTQQQFQDQGNPRGGSFTGEPGMMHLSPNWGPPGGPRGGGDTAARQADLLRQFSDHNRASASRPAPFGGVLGGLNERAPPAGVCAPQQQRPYNQNRPGGGGNRVYALNVCLPITIPYGKVKVTKTNGENYYEFPSEYECAEVLFSQKAGLCDTWATFLQVPLGQIRNVRADQILRVVDMFLGFLEGTHPSISEYLDTSSAEKASPANESSLKDETKALTSEHAGAGEEHCNSRESSQEDGDENKAVLDEKVAEDGRLVTAQEAASDSAVASDAVEAGKNIEPPAVDPIFFKRPIRVKCVGICPAHSLPQFTLTPTKRTTSMEEVDGEKTKAPEKYETHAFFETEEDRARYVQLCQRLKAFVSAVQKSPSTELRDQRSFSKGSNSEWTQGRARGATVGNQRGTPVAVTLASYVENPEEAPFLPLLIREWGELEDERLTRALQDPAWADPICAEGVELGEIRLDHTAKKMVDPRFSKAMILTRQIAGDEDPRNWSWISKNQSRSRGATSEDPLISDPAIVAVSKSNGVGPNTSNQWQQAPHVSRIGRHVFAELSKRPEVEVRYEDADSCMQSVYRFVYERHLMATAGSASPDKNAE